MVHQVIKQWFWDVYDHLGRLLLINLILFFCFLPILFYSLQTIAIFSRMTSLFGTLVLFLSGFVILSTLLGGIWFSGALHFGKLSSLEKDPSPWEFLRGVREAGLRSMKFIFVWSLVCAILLLNIWYYLLSGQAPAALQTIGYGLGGICFWLILLLVGIGMHALPLIVRKPRRVRESFKLGLALTAKYPLQTFGLLLFGVSLLAIGAMAKLIGIIAFGFIGPAMLMNSLHDVVVERETQDEALRTADPDGKPSSWKQIRVDEAVVEEERLRKARYERTFRDILKPWEM